MKVVLDANVFIAAFASRGLCESVLEVCLTKHEIILSKDLLEEVTGNLRSKIKLPKKIIDQIIELLNEFAVIVDPVPHSQVSCRDPDDIKILDLAIAADADYIITGDKDLLILEQCRGIPILNPRSFSDVLYTEDRQ